MIIPIFFIIAILPCFRLLAAVSCLLADTGSSFGSIFPICELRIDKH
jgi:hypothetical protein